MFRKSVHKILCLLMAFSLVIGMIALVQPMKAEAALTGNVLRWGVTLKDQIAVGFDMAIDEEDEVAVTVNGTDASFTKEANEDGTYRVTVSLAAAQMTDAIALSVNGTALGKTYSVRQYADVILGGAYDDITKDLVQNMLVYGGAAQSYFGYNTGSMANEDIAVALPTPEGENVLTTSGKINGLTLHGATLLFKEKTAVRLYFNGSIEGVSFAANGNAADAGQKNGRYYVEIAGINPAQLGSDITVTAAKGSETITVTYSPMTYILRMYSKAETSAELRTLVQALYGYYQAAVAYTNADDEFIDNIIDNIVVDASYQVLGVDGTLTTGVDNSTFGKVMSVSNSTYLALTNNVKSEKAAFRQSKNIGFYIYNPTETDVDGYYTMDWVYNAHFLLKAKEWNYIEFADFGSAAGKQFITSNDTVYFYANMPGEGWLVSSFYGEGTNVEGLATVVDASYQVLGVDGTLTVNNDDATFGKVMSVSGSTYLALTPNVKTENPAFKQSKDIVFYIYNPTDTDVDLYYTMDWVYNGYAQLKANSWNRIHLADLGAAANKQFITSNDTVYFYANMTSEGWLVSSFYALSQIATEQDPVAAVNAQIAALPEATALTTAHSAAVWAASEAYNALSEEDKAQVVGAEKLTACVEKVAFWDKLAEKTVVNAAYQVLGVDGTLTTGVDNNTFGKVMSVSNSTYLALTSNVKSENAAFRQSNNVGFYIYNPTNADVDGYYTMDWVFNAHFLLKAKAWNYIEFADFGSAANKQFITSNDTVYFYANMTGEGWLVSSFYGEGTNVEGLAMVVDASYQVLGVDGTLTVNNDDATFGKVMSVSGSTYLALTPNVKTENPSFKQSKNIVFYIYNPTDTDVDLYYTMDWGYNAYVQLKANSWNRVQLSDLGTASNKQFITSNDTVYFYANMTSEGWLISSFYALPDMG